MLEETFESIILPAAVKCTRITPPNMEFTGPNAERLAVTVLDEDLVRVQMYPQGKARLDRTWLVLDKNGWMPREGRDREDVSQFPLPSFKVEQDDNQITLVTQTLKLVVNLNPFGIQWMTVDGTPLAADLKGDAYPYVKEGQQVRHQMISQSGVRYFGFGEVSGALNKSKRHIFLKNIDNPGYSAKNGSPLYKHIPFYITYQPATGQAFGLFYDNLATTTFDLGTADQKNSVRYTAEAGDVDYYFIYGPSIRGVIEKFTHLTGRMILPPRWSLGYLGSTMNYTEAPDAQAQLANFAKKCREFKIPCDLFHLSSGYTLGEDGKRYVFHWNRKRVPEPQTMVENFHENGIRLAANIKPALLTTHPRFDEVRQLGSFIREPNSNDPQLFHFWGGTAAALDFTNPITVDWWKQQVKEQLLDYGIDSTWNDNNEFEVQEGNARCIGFGRTVPIELARPLQTLMMMRTSYEAQVDAHPNERPFLISRAGAPGMQRYAQTWSGDNKTSWQTLKYNIPMGLGLGLSGTANTGHDVGGFAGLKPSPELFVRWVQNGIFHPRFTIHSWKLIGKANEPWMYPRVFSIVQDSIYFRYRLIPYLYNLMVEAAATGHPMIRPLVYEFPKDKHCTDESFDFMCGPSLLVASVLTPLTRKRRVYLPAGQNWYNFYSDEQLEGGKSYWVDAPLQHIPLFVREGSMIPMGEVVHPLIHAKDDLRQILIFPPAGDGNTTLELTEEDGHSLAYQQGKVTRINIALHSTAQRLEFTVNLAPYQFELPFTEVEFILPAGEKRAFSLTGLNNKWLDEQSRQHFTCKIPKISEGSNE